MIPYFCDLISPYWKSDTRPNTVGMLAIFLVQYFALVSLPLLREAQTCIFTIILLTRKNLIPKLTLISTLFCFHVGVARASQKHDCVRRSAANKETQVWSPANPRPAAAASLFPPLRGVIIALQIFAIAHHYSSQRTFEKVFKITEKAPTMLRLLVNACL